MRALENMKRLVGCFARGRGGNFGMMAAIITPVLVLGVGYAVNIGQVSITRSNLLAALDSAVTSTARDLTTGAITEADAPKIVEAFLMANGLRAFAEDGKLSLDSLVIDRQANTVSAKASVELDVAFALFGAANRQKISAESASIYSDKKVEIAMMLDVTGSMAPDNKLRDLKSSATTAARILLGGQNAVRDRVRIALIPYSNAVNVGSLASSSVFWERNNSERRQAPGNGQATPVASRADNCATERKGDYQYTDHGPEVSMVNRDFLLNEFAKNYRTQTCPTAPLVPLTANLSTIETAINGFVAEGGTAGHIGIQWAWYMLSERWAGVLQASQRPGPAGEATRKYAILMTDGEFNLSYFDAAQVGNVYNDRGKAPPRDAARLLCSEMRKQGIEIFTIGFKLNDANARQTMRDCATPDTGGAVHYFDAATGAELDTAFRTIARNIERLALTK